MATEDEILKALRSRLITFAQSNSLLVEFTNDDDFAIPAAGTWLRETLVPNEPRRLYVGSSAPHDNMGIYQIDLMFPKGAKQTAWRLLAGQIAAHFPTDLPLTSGSTTVRIFKRPHVAMTMVGDIRAQIPITIEWQVFA